MFIMINNKIISVQFQFINANELESLRHLRHGLLLLLILMLDLRANNMRIGHILVHNIVEAFSNS